MKRKLFAIVLVFVSVFLGVVLRFSLLSKLLTQTTNSFELQEFRWVIDLFISRGYVLLSVICLMLMAIFGYSNVLSPFKTPFDDFINRKHGRAMSFWKEGRLRPSFAYIVDYIDFSGGEYLSRLFINTYGKLAVLVDRFYSSSLFGMTLLCAIFVGSSGVIRAPFYIVTLTTFFLTLFIRLLVYSNVSLAGRIIDEIVISTFVVSLISALFVSTEPDAFVLSLVTTLFSLFFLSSVGESLVRSMFKRKNFKGINRYGPYRFQFRSPNVGTAKEYVTKEFYLDLGSNVRLEAFEDKKEGAIKFAGNILYVIPRTLGNEDKNEILDIVSKDGSVAKFDEVPAIGPMTSVVVEKDKIVEKKEVPSRKESLIWLRREGSNPNSVVESLLRTSARVERLLDQKNLRYLTGFMMFMSEPKSRYLYGESLKRGLIVKAKERPFIFFLMEILLKAKDDKSIRELAVRIAENLESDKQIELKAMKMLDSKKENSSIIVSYELDLGVTSFTNMLSLVSKFPPVKLKLYKPSSLELSKSELQMLLSNYSRLVSMNIALRNKIEKEHT